MIKILNQLVLFKYLNNLWFEMENKIAIINSFLWQNHLSHLSQIITILFFQFSIWNELKAKIYNRLLFRYLGELFYSMDLDMFCYLFFFHLEAFFLSNGVLAIATAYKKEFFVTKCDEFPFDDGQWHSLAICQVKPVLYVI